MSKLTTLALLGLFALAAARCPEGQKPIADDDQAQALLIGAEMWGLKAQSWCENFPEVINAAGLEYYQTDITPQCKGDDGSYHFTVETQNPCDELKFYVGYMDVDTDFPGCNKTWLETAGFQPKITATGDAEQLRPLECPTGFKPAKTAAELAKVQQLLWQTVVDPTFKNATEGQFDDAWYCDDANGYKRIEFNQTTLSGCLFEKKSEKEPDNIMGQGAVSWVCAQQARIRTVGLTVSTDYKPTCLWEADLEMGDSPEVPQPEAAQA